MSMLSHLHKTKQMPQQVRLLYTSRLAESGRHVHFLFIDRIREIANSLSPEQFRMWFYVTGKHQREFPRKSRILWRKRRMNHDDLIRAIGKPENRPGVVCYVCGPPAMTDDFVEVLRHAEGMEEQRVLCEKWW